MRSKNERNDFGVSFYDSLGVDALNVDALQAISAKAQSFYGKVKWHEIFKVSSDIRIKIFFVKFQAALSGQLVHKMLLRSIYLSYSIFL